MAAIIGGKEGGRRILGLFPPQRPLISVIIAVYNGGTTLERAIKSVIIQTFSHIELIIIDGGSTDATIDIIFNYDRFIDYWISENDKGIYDAMNKGISLARGEWFYFLGSDDEIVDPDVFSSIFVKQYNSKLLYGNVIFRDNGIIYGGKFTKNILIKKNICQQGILYHRDLFRILGVFSLKYQILADWAFNIKAFGMDVVLPTYLNIIIAKYSLEGASNRIVDHDFYTDKLGLIKTELGFNYYLFAVFNQFKDQLIASLKKYILRPLWNNIYT